MEWIDLLDPRFLLGAAVVIMLNVVILGVLGFFLAAVGRAFIDAVRGRGID